MKVYLTPGELLHVYQTIVMHPMQHKDEQASLVRKMSDPILFSLEKSEEEETQDAYEAWSQQEELRIQSLEKERQEVSSKTPAQPQKKNTKNRRG